MARVVGAAALVVLALGAAAGGGRGAGAPSGLQFDRGGHTWLIDADGTHQRPSPLRWVGTWSDDGARVAYAKPYGAYVAKGDGSDSLRVARLPASGGDTCFVPDWSPDGSWLTFVTGCLDAANLVVERADFTVRRRLARDLAVVRAPRWSPDGRAILFAGRARGADQFGLYVMGLDDARPRRVPRFAFDFRLPETYVLLHWDWSADGRTILALLETQSANLGAELVAVDARTGEERLLTPADLYVDAFDLSPDRTRVALAGGFGGHASEIYVMRADGTHLRRLTHEGGTHPRWSPDGDRIAFASDGVDNCCADVWVMNADGSAQRDLTPGAEWEDYPTWVP